MATGLAYIGRIEALRPIEGADRIESAEVVCGEGGRWSGVVKKGQFGLWQPCVAILQDAIVPQELGLDFLASSNYRVKMARFRGAPSECVIIDRSSAGVDADLVVGTDVTDDMEITKYEKVLPGQIGGSPCGNFPTFLVKTDEPNFQTAGRLVSALRGKPWYATVKCDGSSTTAYKYQGKFGVCSRNLELTESDCAFWRVAKKYNLAERLPEGVAVQFETCGPGIQKNPMGLKDVDGFAFNGFDIKGHAYYSFAELSVLCAEELGMPMVESTGWGSDFDLDSDELRKLAEGTYANGRQREGIVIRPQEEEWVGHARLSFKVINLLYKD